MRHLIYTVIKIKHNTMVKYIFNNQIYVDFDFINQSTERPRATVHRHLQKFIVDNDVETIDYNNRILYSENSISEFIKVLNKK